MNNEIHVYVKTTDGFNTIASIKLERQMLYEWTRRKLVFVEYYPHDKKALFMDPDNFTIHWLGEDERIRPLDVRVCAVLFAEDMLTPIEDILNDALEDLK